MPPCPIYSHGSNHFIPTIALTTPTGSHFPLIVPDPPILKDEKDEGEEPTFFSVLSPTRSSFPPTTEPHATWDAHEFRADRDFESGVFTGDPGVPIKRSAYECQRRERAYSMCRKASAPGYHEESSILGRWNGDIRDGGRGESALKAQVRRDDGRGRIFRQVRWVWRRD